MVDRITYLAAVWLPALGAFIGVGKLLVSDVALCPRVIAGRAITSGGIGLAAGASLIAFPDMNPVALAGVAASLASLGTSFLEKFIQRLLGVKL